MNKDEVIELLGKNKDERGIRHWENKCVNGSGLKSYGIGLTRLRKLAKEVGKDHALALELWESSIYDAKIIAILIDDPKVMTEEQAEKQVEELEGGYLVHVFSTCGSPLAKASFVTDLAAAWIKSKDDVRVRCGYGLIYEISKMKGKKAPDDSYFTDCINLIDRTYSEASTDRLMAMAGALMGIGKRTAELNKAALAVARKIGPVDFDPDGKCDPFDAVKHLTSEYLTKKLGIDN